MENKKRLSIDRVIFQENQKLHKLKDPFCSKEKFQIREYREPLRQWASSNINSIDGISNIEKLKK